MSENPFFAELLENLIDKNRKPDGERFTYAEIQRGIGNRVSSEYIRKLHQGQADNPGYEVIEALSVFFGISPEKFFPSMKHTRDRHLRQIIAGLSGPLDEKLFELCVVDLLKDEFPGLVPIPGGGDMGMDGAFPDGEDTFCPLIATTGENVVSNVERNLKSYLKNGLPSRKVLVVTSQALSQIQRKNIIDKAREYGFQVIGSPYDRLALAYRLKRNPKWSKDLLGITGSPPVLSSIPLSMGFFPEIDLVGREEDYKWLKESSGDRMLVGEPGVGKTFLLQKMALEGFGLFVVDKDKTAIANEIREIQPELLFVDDVHLNLDLLKQLQHIRTELEAEFSILVSCWPNYHAEVERVLILEKENILLVDRLSRPKMVEAIKSMGFIGPDEHMAFILDQVGGRPGLAAVLVWAYMQRDWDKLNSGEAIVEATLRFIDHEEKDKAKAILASFSLGGEYGVELSAVSQNLGINIANMWKFVRGLSACGVVYENHNIVSVQPNLLREALVKDVFFSAPSLPYEGLFNSVPNLNQLALTLMGARVRGGNVSNDIIISVLERCNSAKTWEAFAKLGKLETKWILDNHPEHFGDIAPAVLENLPEKGISILLDLAVGDDRELHSHYDHPIRQIEKWIKAARPGTTSSISRRRMLLNCVKIWFGKEEDLFTALRVLRIALSPGHRDARQNPIERNKVSFISGLISLKEMREIKSWWEEIFDFVKNLDFELHDWEELFRIIEEWAYPSRFISSTPPEVSTFMREFAAEMLVQVLPLAKGSQGILLRASNLANHLEREVGVEVNEDFQLLYGYDIRGDYEEWKKEENERQAIIQEIGRKWAVKNPVDVAGKMSDYEYEAQVLPNRHRYRIRPLYYSISEEVEDPTPWIEAFRDKGLSTDFIEPFLQVLARDNVKKFENLAKQNLDDPLLGKLIHSIALGMDDLSPELLDEILNRLEEDQTVLNNFLIWGTFSKSTITRLLASENENVSSLAAISVWSSEPRGTIPAELEANWHRAIVNISEDVLRDGIHGYEFKQILSSNPSISFDWLNRYLGEGVSFNNYFEMDELLVTAASVLNEDQRKRLIPLVPDSYYFRKVIAALVGDHMENYKILLEKIETDDELRLAPLARYPKGSWFDMAKLARERGYSSTDIAQGIIYQLDGVTDSHSEGWEEHVKVFENLLSHEDLTIQEIGLAGKSYAEKQRDFAREQERMEDLYGY